MRVEGGSLPENLSTSNSYMRRKGDSDEESTTSSLKRDIT